MLIRFKQKVFDKKRILKYQMFKEEVCVYSDIMFLIIAKYNSLIRTLVNTEPVLIYNTHMIT